MQNLYPAQDFESFFSTEYVRVAAVAAECQLEKRKTYIGLANK